VSREHGGG
jgi:FAD/FMN-containing dehydrogenase